MEECKLREEGMCKGPMSEPTGNVKGTKINVVLPAESRLS